MTLRLRHGFFCPDDAPSKEEKMALDRKDTGNEEGLGQPSSRETDEELDEYAKKIADLNEVDRGVRKPDETHGCK